MCILSFPPIVLYVPIWGGLLRNLTLKLEKTYVTVPPSFFLLSFFLLLAFFFLSLVSIILLCGDFSLCLLGFFSHLFLLQQDTVQTVQFHNKTMLQIDYLHDAPCLLLRRSRNMKSLLTFSPRPARSQTYSRAFKR